MGDRYDSFASGSSNTLIGLSAFILILRPLGLPSLKKVRRCFEWDRLNDDFLAAGFGPFFPLLGGSTVTAKVSTSSFFARG